LSRHLLAGSGLFEDFAYLPDYVGGMPIITASPVMSPVVVFPIPTHRAILRECDLGELLEPHRAVRVLVFKAGITAFYSGEETDLGVSVFIDARLGEDEQPHQAIEFVPRSYFKVEFAPFIRGIEEGVFHKPVDPAAEVITQPVTDRFVVAPAFPSDLLQVEIVLEEFIPRAFLDDAHVVGAEDYANAVEAVDAGNGQMRDPVADEAYLFD